MYVEHRRNTELVYSIPLKDAALAETLKDLEKGRELAIALENIEGIVHVWFDDNLPVISVDAFYQYDTRFWSNVDYTIHEQLTGENKRLTASVRHKKAKRKK